MKKAEITRLYSFFVTSSSMMLKPLCFTVDIQFFFYWQTYLLDLDAQSSGLVSSDNKIFNKDILVKTEYFYFKEKVLLPCIFFSPAIIILPFFFYYSFSRRMQMTLFELEKFFQKIWTLSQI